MKCKKKKKKKLKKKKKKMKTKRESSGDFLTFCILCLKYLIT